MMLVVIDCRLWNETGVGRYLRNLVGELLKRDSKTRYHLLFRSAEYEKLTFPKNVTKVLVEARWHSVKEQFAVPWALWRLKPDLVHFPYPNVPLLYRGRFVVTIHDLTPYRLATGRASTLPRPLYLIKRLGYYLALRTAVYRSEKVLVVSEATRQDLLSFFPVDPQKMVVTHNALPQAFAQAGRLSAPADRIVLGKLGLKRPYLFYVGNAHPHKNLERLVKAFYQLREKYPRLSLVLVGKKDFFYQRLETWVRENFTSPEKVVFPGFVDQDLPALYRQAEAHVLPSLREGFGLTLLEAFACQTPVVCSDIPVLREVGGEACGYFDPTDELDIAEKLDHFLQFTSEKRSRRVKRGLERVSQFSWSETAIKTLAVYHSTG